MAPAFEDPLPITCGWPMLDVPVALAEGEVHVWCAELIGSEAQLAAWRDLLSSDEQARADRLRLEKLRRRYVVGRAWLRRLLGHYLQIAPAAVRFQYHGLGKPSLAGPEAELGLEFNVSNSQNVALLAFAWRRPLGVDVEWVRPMPNAEGLANRYFATDEQRRLAELPAAERNEAFFRCWTRKEALLKAWGVGLSVPLSRVSVSVAANEPAQLLTFDGDTEEARQWWLTHLQPTPRYVAALASRGAALRVRSWTCGR